ncbi:MAG: TRAP transporter small permease [Muricoprocola sp.]
MEGFFKKLEVFKPVYDAIYAVCLFLCKIFLIADVLITTMAVLGRYIPFIPDPSWSEEVVLTLMSYMAVLSAAMAIRKNKHIRMDAFDPFMPKKMIQILDLVADVAVFALAIIMVVYGQSLAMTLGAKATYISMPWLSKFWMYFPIPLAGIFMIVFEIEVIVNHVKVLVVKEGE